MIDVSCLYGHFVPMFVFEGCYIGSLGLGQKVCVDTRLHITAYEPFITLRGVNTNGIFICGRTDLHKRDLRANCYSAVTLLSIAPGPRCVDKHGFD